MLKKRLVVIICLLYTGVLVAASLTKVELPNAPKNSDKIYHFLAYFIFAFLWFATFLYTTRLSYSKTIGLTFLFSVGFGIIIEILQYSLTTYRTFDVKDIAANTIGVILAVIILRLTEKIKFKNKPLVF